MYKIYGDSCCDLPVSYAAERNINLVPLSYTVDGVEYTDDGKNADNILSLYAKMRDGKLTNTSQPSPEELYNIFEASAKNNEELIYMTLSSGISGTYNSACLMLERCMEEYPEAKISVIDSLCASGGYGLLMQRIADNRDNGMSYEEAVEWIKNNRLNVIHWFTVEDLAYLHRGGRVSKAKAIITGVLNIKPIMHVDQNGFLVATGISRGRKNSLKELVKNALDDIESYSDENYMQSVYINHADAYDDALMCKSLMSGCKKIKQITINSIGPTIGCHSGPGTIAIFCFGNNREKEKK